LNFTTDIDGETRPTGANTWDIGADQYVSISAAALIQEGFRFRNDDGNETTATWIAAQDVNIKQVVALRLRVLIDATGDPVSQDYQLEYRRKADGGSWGDWGKVNPE
jgi:hypothetical protein